MKRQSLLLRRPVPDSPAIKTVKEGPQADLYVSYRGGIEDCVWFEVDSFGYGGTLERKHQEATLAIELIESPKSEPLLFNGSVVREEVNLIGNRLTAPAASHFYSLRSRLCNRCPIRWR